MFLDLELYFYLRAKLSKSYDHNRTPLILEIVADRPNRDMFTWVIEVTDLNFDSFALSLASLKGHCPLV